MIFWHHYSHGRDAKEKTLTILDQDNDNILEAFENLTDVVGNLAGIGNAIGDTESLKDSLAETWGYELFEYAHNNVCNRVLDSCFNGIYEACGTPPIWGAPSAETVVHNVRTITTVIYLYPTRVIIR